MILLGGHIDHFLFPKQVDLTVEVLVEVLSLIQVTSFFYLWFDSLQGTVTV